MSAKRSTPSPIRVFLLSDHRILLWGLQQLIATEPDAFTVCGNAANTDEALQEPSLATADVVVLDMECESDSVPPNILRLLSVSQAKILLLTRLDDLDKQDKSVLAGASGVVKHQTSPDMLLTAIEKVQEGQMWLDREATGRVFVQFSRRVANRPATSKTPSVSALTDREQQIVSCVADNSGEPGKVIAKKLNISESTLRNHLTSIYDKLGVTNRHGLTAYAFKNGLSKASS